MEREGEGEREEKRERWRGRGEREGEGKLNKVETTKTTVLRYVFFRQRNIQKIYASCLYDRVALFVSFQFSGYVPFYFYWLK